MFINIQFALDGSEITKSDTGGAPTAANIHQRDDGANFI